MAQDQIKNMAVFCDFENVALGVQDAKYEKFDIQLVLEKLLVKGSIVVKKAYCDWERYRRFKAAMHGASFELIEVPHVRQSGKNSADIRMVVDALDLCYTKSHVDTFVIVSGDSDFSPLVSKLRENAKTVIGVGVKNSTSDLLIGNCDEFIYYDDLVRVEGSSKARKKATRKSAKTAERAAPVTEAAETAPAPAPEPASEPVAEEAPRASRAKSAKKKAAKKSSRSAAAKSASEKAQAAAPVEAAQEPEPTREADRDRKQEAIDLVLGIVEALAAERGEDEKVWGSAVKQTLKRRNPGFNESYYGFKSFSALLEEAAKRRLLSLDRDEKSGGYIVRSERG